MAKRKADEIAEATGVEGRVYNFSAGPSIMPVEVLQECQMDMLNWKGCGMGVMEMSHRGKEFDGIAKQAEKDLRDVLSIPAGYKVIFVQGGATLQFSAVPLNMLGEKKKCAQLVSGQWSEKAHKEVKKYGTSSLVAPIPAKFGTVPARDTWTIDAEASYFHYCMNETVNGVEIHSTPNVGDVPMVADMSSNFVSRPIDVSKYACIYAGIQKNLGPAGMCVNIIRDDFATGKNELGICPTYCSWKTLAGQASMYNTPACWSMYVMGLYLQYTKKVGGVAHWAEMSEKKSGLIYSTIDGSDGFYTGPVAKDCRSRMNIPFQIKGGDEALEKKFLQDAQKVKLFQLAGHRSVGGIRASLYNGMPMEGVEKLADFMKSFMDENRS